MQKLVPNIWCNDSADEAAAFYLRAFPQAVTANHQRYPETGLLDFQQSFAGKTLQIDVVIGGIGSNNDGYVITLINADDTFRPNPTVSLRVSVSEPEEFERLRSALSRGGRVLEHLHIPTYGGMSAWVEDPFGVSWQLVCGDRDEIAPCLMFAGQARGRARQAAQKYRESFPGSGIEQTATYAELPEPAHEQLVAEHLASCALSLAGERIYLMDYAPTGTELGGSSGNVGDHLAFGGGLALLYNAHGQAELDRVWDALSAVPEAEQCGWLRDEFGVSWEIIPDNLGELMAQPGAYEKLMGMKKIVIADF